MSLGNLDSDPFAEEYDLGGGDGIIGQLQSYAPKIIGVIVVLVVLFLVYSFFFGGIVKTSFNVKDFEGKPLVKNSIKIYPVGDNKAIETGSNQTSYDFELKAGKYKITVSSSGFKKYSEIEEITEKDKDFTIKLEKDLDVKLKPIEGIPSIVYSGNSFELTAFVENNKDKSIEVEFVTDFGKQKNITSEFAVQTLKIPANSIEGGTITIDIPDNFQVKDEKDGDEIKVELRIKYTNEKQEFSFIVLPMPELTFSDSISFRSIDASDDGKIYSEELDIRNRSEFPAEDIEIGLEIITASKNSPEEVEKWFIFPQGNTIDVSADDRIKLPINLQVPLTAKKEDISGNLIITAPFYSEPKKISLNLKITSETNINLDVSVPTYIAVDWDADSLLYSEEIKTVRVRNNGDLRITNIDFGITNEGECNSNWFSFKTGSNIEYIEAGDESELSIGLTAPAGQHGNTSIMECTLEWSYLNPLNTSKIEKDSTLIRIEPN